MESLIRRIRAKMQKCFGTGVSYILIQKRKKDFLSAINDASVKSKSYSNLQACSLDDDGSSAGGLFSASFIAVSSLTLLLLFV